MSRVSSWSFGKLAGSALVGCAIAAAQYVPRPLSANRANVAVGGCSSGLCSNQKLELCAYAGDACAGYIQCVPNEDGPSICTPQSFCGGAGCGAQVIGGVCN
jgi:hypothetical protein